MFNARPCCKHLTCITSTTSILQSQNLRRSGAKYLAQGRMWELAVNSDSLDSEPALPNVGCEEFRSCGREVSSWDMEETPPLGHRISDQEGDAVPVPT